MSNDNKPLTRRRVLGSLGAIGVSAAATGAGTTALFTDNENSTGNAITAGELDFQIDWTEHYNGEEVEEQALTDNPGPIFELDDVKPGDYGEATISLHVFDNPAWVHMGGVLTANNDNGLTEPESEVDDTAGKGEGELADEILARAWYDGTGNDEDGGNNTFDDDEVQITAGTLADVLADLNRGVLLDDQTTDSGGSTPTQCTEGPKIDRAPRKNEEISVGNGTVTITNLYTKREDRKEETIGFDWTSSGVELCKIEVKGGPETETTAYECATSGTAFSTFNEKNRKYREISNVTFYYCEDDGGGDGKDCFPNSTTQYIGFEWTLPRDVGNVIQSDSVEFELKFHAQQCRHVNDPENPFAGN